MVSIPQVQVPDFTGTMFRAEQGRAARQAALDTERFNTGLTEIAPLLAQGEGADYTSALARLAGLGPRGAQLALPMLQADREMREFRSWQGGGAPAATAAPMATTAVAGAPAGGDMLTRIAAVESGGNDGARNPGSSAAGRFQIIDATWNQYAPRLGLRPDQRMDPAAQEQVARAIQADAQRAIGRPLNPGEQYGAHLLGIGGLRAFLSADPNADAREVYAQAAGPQIAAQAFQRNPGLLEPGMTVAQVMQRLGQRVGGASAAAPAASAQAAATAGIDPAELARIEQGLMSPNRMIREASARRLEVLRFRAQQARAERRSGENTGPFAGTGMEAQNNNIVLRLADKIRNGTATPQEMALYQRAYTSLAEGQIQLVNDPSDPTGQRQVMVRVPRDMGDLPPPRRGGQVAAPAAPAAAPAGAPAGQPGDSVVPAQAGGMGDASAMPTLPNAIPGMERVIPPPAGYRRREDGSLEAIPGGPQDQTRQPLSESQARANLFGAQMVQAEDILSSARPPSGPVIALWRNAPEVALNPALSDNDQRYFNAVRLFAAGILRKETGAAFTATELLDVHSRFFPQPGDSAATIAQKARARQQALESIRAEIPGGFRGVVSGPQAGPGGQGSAEPPQGGTTAPRVIRYDAQGRRISQ